MSYRVTNPKGETRTGLTAEDVSVFKAVLARRGITDPRAAGYILEEETVQEPAPAKEQPTDGRTTVEQRREYFGNGEKDNAALALSEVFPSLAERHMQKKDGFSLGTVGAGLSDVFSLPGRFVAGLGGVKETGSLDLGRRSGEGTSAVGSVVRDPVTGASVFGAGAIGKGVQALESAGGKAANYVLGKVLPKAAPVAGRVAGATTAGAATGVGMEKLSSEFNGREPDYTLGAVLGGAFDGLGSAATQLLQSRGKEFVKSVASALRLGNTERRMTDSELAQFLADERNVSALQKALQNIDERPLVNDRGKGLEGILETERENAVSVLKDQPALNSGFATGIDENMDITRRELARRRAALNDPDVESYRPKTPYRGGGINEQDLAYGSEPEGMFRKPTRAETKSTRYQSNMENHLEQYATKYDKIGRDIENANIRPGAITTDEQKFLQVLSEEIQNDRGILSGYNPDKLLTTNRFFKNFEPFGTKFDREFVTPFINEHNAEGFSSQFLREVRKLTNGATEYGRGVSNSLNDALEGRVKSAVERAFMYAKTDPIMVKRGYTKAIDRFADRLSDYADASVGMARRDSKGKEYSVSKEKMKSYSFQYLNKVQEALEKRGALTADEIVSLYGQATNVNDREVQDAILQLLKDLKVPAENIEEFKRVGGNYAMLNKARTRTKKNTKEDNPLKGTVLAPVVPQEGINAVNAGAYGLQRNNIDLMDLGRFRNDPTRIGTGTRAAVYSLGLPFAHDVRK